MKRTKINNKKINIFERTCMKGGKNNNNNSNTLMIGVKIMKKRFLIERVKNIDTRSER